MTFDNAAHTTHRVEERIEQTSGACALHDCPTDRTLAVLRPSSRWQRRIVPGSRDAGPAEGWQ